MSLFKSLLVLSLVSIGIFVSMAHADDLRTVPYVDVGRYAGTWYQIARNPLFFEGDCACSRQVLAPLSPGVVSVYNSCNDKSPAGALREIRGTATDEDTVTNAKFLVDFDLPSKGQYWIIGLASDYQYAVVSDPSLKSLYVLSKTPTLSAELYQQALNSVKEQIDTSKLVITEQQGCTYPQ